MSSNKRRNVGERRRPLGNPESRRTDGEPDGKSALQNKPPEITKKDIMRFAKALPDVKDNRTNLCKNCGKPIDPKPNISIRNSVPVYKHTDGEYFCNRDGIPKYSHAEPNKEGVVGES